ncbi:MAG: glycerol-3-phosphate dehydrogenase, partial [Verrucomicrobia bacterium]|nr:glycerol-3-phosphate dehydrogenase [Verrucomicrobiota bacterium]
MRCGYFGAGTWGFALASILGNNGHSVKVWARDPA